MSKRWLTAGLLVAGAVVAVILFPHGTNAQSGLGAAVPMKGMTSFRILFGLADQEPTAWDGSVKVSGGTIHSITGWRFFGDDLTDYQSTWKLSTRRNRPAQNPNGPIVENGIVVTAGIPDENAKFEVQTLNGSFSFTAKQVPYGEGQTFLAGRVAVDRVPPTVQLTPSQEDQDFPAVAQSAGDVWATYVEFTHGDRTFEIEGNLPKAPDDFKFLTRPAGGDQVILRHFSKASSTWEAPIAVSDKGLDVMRAAVAVDGQKRVWVIWSANKNGNFDLYAKYMDGEKWSPEMRITTDPGQDLNPVAATDAKGRVWIAWQAFRADNLDILAAVQSGDRFVKETRVSFSPRSDWDPSIAAAPNGDVAIAWDTYDKGDYDVYFRRVRADLSRAPRIAMDAPVAVAASTNFEARSSIVFDPQNRLWVAYETSDARWGKDYGAYQTTGIALYQGHNIQVKCFDGPNAFTTADSLEDKLPLPPQALLRLARRRMADQVPTPGPESLKQPNPEIAKNRRPNQGALPPPLAQNSFPRITVDAAGTLYLAFRVPGGAWVSPVGSVWFENIMYFDGARWLGPLFVPRTDGLLDGRPALAALDPGHLMILSAMDHRQSEMTGNGRRGAAGVNSDIYAADLRVDVSQAATPALKALPVEHPAVPDSVVKPELDQVALMRTYRMPAGKDTLHIMRGEFHRHTEISGDGRNDGPLIDAYRYMIDAAYMDWVACCDHDNGNGHEYFWWLNQKLTDAYHLGNRFVPMFGYERSVQYPEGHRNAVFPTRGIRPLPRLPRMAEDSAPTPAPDTQMLYRYLKEFGGIVASHTSGTAMGTDWRDNDPQVEPVVEIYQGDRQNYEMPDAPRSNSEKDSIGGWRPLGFVSLALQKGYRLAFQASSDHVSTHMAYCNLWVTAPTREGIMEAFHKRRVYGATDNILADVHCGTHMMGEEFSVSVAPSISVKLIGTGPFAKVHIVKDNNYVYSVEPKTAKVAFTWQDNAAVKGKTSYYYVRGEQEDGQLVWVSPMWITLTP
jgi:hypothetical protein